MQSTRKHVLIVEDDADNLEMLKVMLEDEFDVTGVTTCKQALMKAGNITPDLLVMDIGMPDIDGIECLGHIRSVCGLGSVPAIALTAFAYPEDKRKFLAAGFQAVVPKPVTDQKELRQLIRAVN